MKTIIKMRFLWLLFVNFVVISCYQDEPPCAIEGVGRFAWNDENFQFPDKIDDNHVGIIAEFNCTNVKEVELRNVHSIYVTANLEDNILTFSVTDEFKKFEENDSEKEILVDFYMKCVPEEPTNNSGELLDEDEQAEAEELEDKEYHLKLKQTINDLNTFAPKFTKDEYVFQYYQDLSTDDILTDAQRISAEDRDITTQQYTLSFEIEKNDYFSIASSSKDDFNKRLVHARVKSKTYIKAPFNETFTITVSDGVKNNPKTGTTKLNVQLFTEQTIVFTKSVYQAELIGKDIKIIDGPIAVEGGLDLATNFEIKSDDDMADKFEIKQTINTITLNLDRTLDPELINSRDYLYLTVTANKFGRVGHFAVMIKTNREEVTTTTTITTEEPGTTTPNLEGGGLATSLEAFERWILAGTALIWVSFVLLAIAFLMVIYTFKKYWQKKYKL